MENDQQNEGKEKVLSIFKVYYLHGSKNEKTGKYQSAFVRITAFDVSEALAKAKENGVTGNHRLARWLMPRFERKAD